MLKARSEVSTNRRWSKPRVFAFASLLLIGASFPRGCTGCRAVRSLRKDLFKFMHAQAIVDPPSAERMVCPTLNSSPVQPVMQGQGGHRAILSWRASAAGDSKHAAAAGYCIYRVDEDKESSQPPQLLNFRPVQGTRCADDWVKNAGRYHYLVRAISPRGALSDPSNLAHVMIPGEGQSGSASAEAPAPLCREPNTPK